MLILTEQKQTQVSSKESLAEEISELKVSLASKREQLRNQNEKLHRLSEEWSATVNKLELYRDDLSLLTNEMTSSSSGEEQLSRCRSSQTSNQK